MKVRKGVTFPSGNEMTARDVKWSKDRAFAAKANVAGVYRLIGLTEASQVEVVDDYTVRFTQSQPSDLSGHIQVICLFVYDSEELTKHATADDPWAKEWATRTRRAAGPTTSSTTRRGRKSSSKRTRPSRSMHRA